MTKWVDDAFKKAMISDGSEIDTFFEKLPNLLAAFEKAIGKEEAVHVMQLMIIDKTAGKFIALAFGAGMVEGRAMLQKTAE